MKITVEKVVRARLEAVWDAWNSPADIKQWDTVQDDLAPGRRSGKSTNTAGLADCRIVQVRR